MISMLTRRHAAALPVIDPRTYDEWRRWESYPSWYRLIKRISDPRAEQMRASWRYVNAYHQNVAAAQQAVTEKRDRSIFGW